MLHQSHEKRLQEEAFDTEKPVNVYVNDNGKNWDTNEFIGTYKHNGIMIVEKGLRNVEVELYVLEFICDSI